MLSRRLEVRSVLSPRLLFHLGSLGFDLIAAATREFNLLLVAWIRLPSSLLAPISSRRPELGSILSPRLRFHLGSLDFDLLTVVAHEFDLLPAARGFDQLPATTTIARSSNIGNRGQSHMSCL